MGVDPALQDFQFLGCKIDERRTDRAGLAPRCQTGPERDPGAAASAVATGHNSVHREKSQRDKQAGSDARQEQRTDRDAGERFVVSCNRKGA